MYRCSYIITSHRVADDDYHNNSHDDEDNDNNDNDDDDKDDDDMIHYCFPSVSAQKGGSLSAYTILPIQRLPRYVRESRFFVYFFVSKSIVRVC